MLDPSVFLKDALKNQKFSDGRSGSFFVFSPDKRFILKTIPKHEFEALESLLPEYYRVCMPHHQLTPLNQNVFSIWKNIQIR